MQQTNKWQLKQKKYLSQNIIIDEHPVKDLKEDDAYSFPNLIWQVKAGKDVPITEQFVKFQQLDLIKPAQKFITLPGKLAISLPVETIKPLITKTNIFIQAHIDVLIERQRRVVEQVSLEDLLVESKIEDWMLMPAIDFEEIASAQGREMDIQRRGVFELEAFDSPDLDRATPSEWLNLGLVDGIEYPVPGKAFVPILEDLQTERIAGYSWQLVVAGDYNTVNNRWQVVDVDTGMIYETRRICLMFVAENPYDFVQRIKSAVTFREATENFLKFELIVDTMVIADNREVDPKFLGRVKTIATRGLKFQVDEYTMNDIENQINTGFRRVNITFEFRHFLINHPEEYHFLTVPDIRVERTKVSKVTFKPYGFRCIQDILKRAFIFYSPESVEAMIAVAVECQLILENSLFNLPIDKAVPLSDFLSTQLSRSQTVIKYLKILWVDNIASQIYSSLTRPGKGALDVGISDWYVYLNAKMSRFMLQVKFRMQDAIRYFLLCCINQFSEYVRGPCMCMISVQEDYIWDTELLKSPFNETYQPIFSLTLSLAREKAFYSTPPEEFPDKIPKTFKDIFQNTCGIKQIDATVMSNIVFQKLYLPTVELADIEIIEERNQLLNAYIKACIPLRAYARRYEEYIELNNTNLVEFLKILEEKDLSPQELKEEIIRYKQLDSHLQASIPTEITIGPFAVSVKFLKQNLLDKTRDITRGLMDFLTTRIFEHTEELANQYRFIFKSVTEKATSIEQVFEIREFAQGAPELVKELEQRVRVVLFEYDILDYFLHNITDNHCTLKWETIAWPLKILKEVHNTPERQKREIDEFRKIHTENMISFEASGESLNEEIKAYALVFDPNKAVETAVDIKKTWIGIEELQRTGELLQSRQKYFELPDLELEFLESIVESFLPYKTLWTACSYFVKLEDLAYGNPLAILNLDDLSSKLESIKQTLEESCETFSEKEEIVNVAKVFLGRIEGFVPVFEIITWLRSPYWTQTHWKELAETTEIDIKYSATLSMKVAAKKGILEHHDLIYEIYQRAAEEAEETMRRLEEEERLRREASEALRERKKRRVFRADIL